MEEDKSIKLVCYNGIYCTIDGDFLRIARQLPEGVYQPDSYDDLAKELNLQGCDSPRFLFSDLKGENNEEQTLLRNKGKNDS